MPENDYYKILGVTKDADTKAIKNAYRKLAFEYHPDRNRDNPEAMTMMKLINEAYAVLSNPEKRKDYDSIRSHFGGSAYEQFRHQYSDQDIFNGSDINRILEEMAEAFGFRNFDALFKEFYGQGYQSFKFEKPGFVFGGFFFGGSLNTHQQSQIPMPDMSRLGRVGKLLIKKVTGHVLPEKGKDIHDTVYLSPQHALQGGPYAYYLKKRDKKLVVNIPAGVKDHQKIRLSEMGESGKGGGASGDLFLKVRIRVPMMKKIRNMLNGLKNR